MSLITTFIDTLDTNFSPCINIHIQSDNTRVYIIVIRKGIWNFSH